MSRKWTLNTVKNFLLTLKYLINSHLDASYLCCFLPGAKVLNSCFPPVSPFHEHELFHSRGILSVWSSVLVSLPPPHLLVHFIVRSPVLQSTIQSFPVLLHPPVVGGFFFFLGCGQVTYRVHALSQLDFVCFWEVRKPGWGCAGFLNCSRFLSLLLNRSAVCMS